MLGGVAVAAAADAAPLVFLAGEAVGEEGAASAAARRNSAKGLNSALAGSGVAERLF